MVLRATENPIALCAGYASASTAPGIQPTCLKRYFIGTTSGIETDLPQLVIVLHHLRHTADMP